MSRTDAGALDAAGLAAGYRTRAQPPVITRATFRIEPGTIAAVLGTNGSGKTTLLRTLVGLLPPVSGTVMLGDSTIADQRARHGIGYLPETLTFNPAWTVSDLLQLTAFSARADVASVTEACRLARLDFDRHMRIAQLSKGMRQRVGLAMSLIPVPALLLLDEPEAGLDPAQRIGLREHVRELASSGCIVLIASHDVAGICDVADQRFLLSNGTMTAVTRDELSDPAKVLKLFAGGGV